MSKNTARQLDPEDFAEFSEEDLRDLAMRIQTVPTERIREEISAHPIGAKLLQTAGSVDEVVRPVIGVWGAEDLAQAA